MTKFSWQASFRFLNLKDIHLQFQTTDISGWLFLNTSLSKKSVNIELSTFIVEKKSHIWVWRDLILHAADLNSISGTAYVILSTT